MKKIYSLSLLLFGMLAFSSCSDDNDNPYATETSITIVKSDLTFDAAASEGSVVYTSTGNIVATTSASWCKAEMKGDSVVVSVAQNNSRNGRAASVTLHNGADSVSLAVLQQGVVTEMETTSVSLSDDNAKSLRYGFDCSIDLEVTSCPDWATARIENDSLYIDIAENTTGHLRRGYIVYASESYVDSIPVFQADFDKDIAGKYTICYQKSEDDPSEKTMRNKTLTKTSLYVLSTLSLPLTYDSENGALKVQTGSYIGTSTKSGATYYVYLAFGMGSYWTSYYSEYSVSAELNYNDVDGTYAEFKGYVAGYEFTNFLFRRFTEQSFSEDADAGSNVYTMYHPMIKRAPTTTTSTGVSDYITRK